MPAAWPRSERSRRAERSRIRRGRVLSRRWRRRRSGRSRDSPRSGSSKCLLPRPSVVPGVGPCGGRTQSPPARTGGRGSFRRRVSGRRRPSSRWRRATIGGRAGVAQLAERQPSKLHVASSNLVSRSTLESRGQRASAAADLVRTGLDSRVDSPLLRRSGAAACPFSIGVGTM